MVVDGRPPEEIAEELEEGRDAADRDEAEQTAEEDEGQRGGADKDRIAAAEDSKLLRGAAGVPCNGPPTQRIGNVDQ